MLLSLRQTDDERRFYAHTWAATDRGSAGRQQRADEPMRYSGDAASHSNGVARGFLGRCGGSFECRPCVLDARRDENVSPQRHQCRVEHYVRGFAGVAMRRRTPPDAHLRQRQWHRLQLSGGRSPSRFGDGTDAGLGATGVDAKRLHGPVLGVNFFDALRAELEPRFVQCMSELPSAVCGASVAVPGGQHDLLEVGRWRVGDGGVVIRRSSTQRSRIVVGRRTRNRTRPKLQTS
jgi:hypothetical protein